MARLNWATLVLAGRYFTQARSVARLTLASSTPSNFFKARSTRFTQAAQVMPVTPSSTSATTGV